MRFVTYFFSIILFTASSSEPERIAWSSERQLRWSDFKGTSNVADGWAAVTSSGISQSYEIDENGYLSKEATKVTAHFYPEYSWVRQRERTKYLLGHEQVHFDITELHAAKLRAEIEAFTFTAESDEEIRQLYIEVEQQRIAMQRLFDKETQHSINHMKEVQWELKVARWLEEGFE